MEMVLAIRPMTETPVRRMPLMMKLAPYFSSDGSALKLSQRSVEARELSMREGIEAGHFSLLGQNGDLGLENEGGNKLKLEEAY